MNYDWIITYNFLFFSAYQLNLIKKYGNYIKFMWSCMLHETQRCKLLYLLMIKDIMKMCKCKL